jgi:hypothetical protein
MSRNAAVQYSLLFSALRYLVCGDFVVWLSELVENQTGGLVSMFVGLLLG